MSKTIFSANMKRARTFHELSASQAAATCNVTAKTWLDLEEGLAEPGISLLLKIANGLQITNIRAFIADADFLTKRGDTLLGGMEAADRVRNLENALEQMQAFIADNLSTKKANPEPVVLYSGGLVVNM